MTKEQCRACGKWFEDSELDAHLSEHMNDEPESPLPQGAEVSRSLLDPNRNYYFVNPGYRGFLIMSYVWGNIYDEYANAIARSRKRVLLESRDIPARHTILDVPAGKQDVPWKVLSANKAFARGTRTWNEVLFEELDGTPAVCLRTERGRIIDGSGNLLATTKVKVRGGWGQGRPRMSLILPPIGGDEALIADQAKRPHSFSRPTDEFEITDRLGKMIAEVREYNPPEIGERHYRPMEERVRASTWKTLMWSENIDRSRSTKFYALHVLDPSYDRRILIGLTLLYLRWLHRSAASD